MLQSIKASTNTTCFTQRVWKRVFEFWSKWPFVSTCCAARLMYTLKSNITVRISEENENR